MGRTGGEFRWDNGDDDDDDDDAAAALQLASLSLSLSLSPSLAGSKSSLRHGQTTMAKASLGCAGAVEGATTLRTSTRRISIPRVARKRGSGAGEGACRWSFEELCGSGPSGMLGAADYSAIASAFHTVVLTGVPALGAADASDRAKRLIVAIDAMYQHRTKLVLEAAVPANELFDASRGSEAAEAAKEAARLGDLLDSGKYVQVDSDAAFAFDRCVSRLMEMQTSDYQDAPHAAATAVSAAATNGGSKHTNDGRDAGFLLAFESQTLSEEDIVDIWQRYDADSSGDIDREELRVLAEDLSQIRSGHRNVSDEQIEATFAAFLEEGGRQQSDGIDDGEVPIIDWEVFHRVLSVQGLVVEGVEGTAASRRVQQTRLSNKTQFHVFRGASNADYKSF